MRRAFESGKVDQCASEIMGSIPLTISENRLAAEAANAIKERGVTQIISIDSNGAYSGIVHLHDLIREGIVN